jgi:hypothetical protein
MLSLSKALSMETHNFMFLTQMAALRSKQCHLRLRYYINLRFSEKQIRVKKDGQGEGG